MSRSSKKGPYVDERLIKKVRAGMGDKGNPIKTWMRDSQVPPEFVGKYFTWTSTRIEGIGINEVAAETEKRHRDAFPERPFRELDLDWGGRYQWRRDGEKHLFNPDTVHKLQNAVHTNNYKALKQG